MLRSLVLFACLFTIFSLSAQTDYGGPEMITCSTRDTADTFVPAPRAFLEGSVGPGTEFVLVFSDSVPAVARSAMRFAADVWGSYLESDVPVVVEIDWQDRNDARLLASAGPATLFRGFVGAEPDVWYPVALAEAIAGRDLNDPEDADIVVSANSTANWYFGTDGNTPRREIDLVSVMLHELGHGLGFLSSVDTINENQLAIGFGTRFIIYDLFLETPDGVPLTEPTVFTNPSEDLLMAATSNNLRFGGPRATEENGGQRPPLFTPAVFDNGSSVSHLNENTYRPGDINALMTPFLSAGEAAHDPGPVTLGLFEDMGWTINFDLVSTTEQLPQSFRVYPNPATDEVALDLPPTLNRRALTLLDANGKVARSQVQGPGQALLSVRGLPAGFYVLLVEDGTQRLRSRVVVR